MQQMDGEALDDDAECFWAFLSVELVHSLCANVT